jgi:hypothetical protein
VSVVSWAGASRLDVGGLARDRQLWIDRQLAAAVPLVLLGVAVECAAEFGPLAVTYPGRAELLGEPWPLGRLAYGRTVPNVEFHDTERPLGWGTICEVDPDLTSHDLAAVLGHELMHVRGIRDHVAAERLGLMLVRGASRR